MTRLLVTPLQRRFRPYAALLVVGFVPALVVALASGRAFDAWWYSGEAILAAIAFALGTMAAVRHGRLLATAFTWAALALMVVVTSVFLASLLGWSGVPTRRFVLGFSTPILLGDSLVILAIVVYVLSLVRTPWVLALGFVAQAATGTRTSWMAIAGAALAAYLVGRSARPWLRVVAVVTAIGILIGAGFLLSRSSGNLLSASGDVHTGVWNLTYAHVTTKPFTVSDGPGRLHGATATHVVATRDPTSRYPSLILLQLTAPSRPKKPYVASAYLRADEPASVVLGSGLGRTTCGVTKQWTRCVTPARDGNGHTFAAFSLQFPPSVGHVAFDMWGAQLEQASVPGPPQVTPRLTAITSVLNRFRNPGSMLDRDIKPRLATMAAAWSMFVGHPWAGVGLQGWAEAYARTPWSRTYPGLPDSHDQVLYALATGGVWALIALLLPPLGALVLLRRAWRRWIPLAVGLFLITVLDVTFYYAFIYIPFWFAIGFLAQQQSAGLLAGGQQHAVDGSLSPGATDP